MNVLRALLRSLFFLFVAAALLSLTSPESIWNGMLLFSALLALVARVLYLLSELPRPQQLHACRQCGHEGRPRRAYRGSSFVELGLWLLLFLPGLVYTWLRVVRRRELRCAECRSDISSGPAEPPA